MSPWRAVIRSFGRVPSARYVTLGIAVIAVLAGLSASAGAPAARSGLSWASGAYLINDTPAGGVAFASWRRRRLDVVDDFPARATWDDVANPTWLYQRWKGRPYTMAFGVAMIPENVPGVSLNACSKGNYNAYWRKFGSVIQSYGLGHSIIRLGWEFNGDWYVWKAAKPATWAECWRQIVTSARSTAPGLQWDWNVNRGVGTGLPNPKRAYPGNAYVNMIGVDSYDWWPPATTKAGWRSQLYGPQGLKYWLTFAEAHGKPLSVPEWGNVTSSSTAGSGAQVGGDDPRYVRTMEAFFKAHAAQISFECNFQGGPTSTGGSYGAGTAVPNASAAYRARA
jgi:hypothetical protein